MPTSQAEGLQTDLKEAERFLLWAHPQGPWVLTAIPVEGGGTNTETFFDIKAALGWVDQRSGRENIYWTVNRVRGALSKKPSKEDIVEAVMLHVDVDPGKGLDVDTERTRIAKLLEDFSPSPSVIIDSGGGFQSFWRLDEPLYLGGTKERWEDLEAYNRQLQIVMKADSCFNVDRIMRLPGTINLPDEKKRKKGRVARVARIVSLSGITYPLSDFTAAAEVQTSNGSGAAAVRVQISGNLPRLKDLDELPEQVTQRTRMLIVQGDDPDDPTRYSSKSEVMWAVTCELIRAGCENDTIAAVLLDPDFGISDHPLRQKRAVEYVARQIERAREEVIEPMLRMLNEKHAVVADIGGKCRVISESLDQNLARPRTRISKQSFEDFRNRYMHIKVQVGKNKDGSAVYMPAGNWWLLNPLRRQYDSIVFAPGREVVDAYNLWKGFACEAIPGQGHLSYLAHLRDNVCSGVEEHYCYLIGWMAYAIQNPGEPGQVAVVLRGNRGTGKGTTAQVFGSLWGRHFLHVSSAKHLVGNFNSHLRDCVFLFADEAFFAGDRAHESTLKTLVTEDTLPIEGKGVDVEVAGNHVHLLMASNSDWVVPAGVDERRFFVLEAADSRKQDVTYFRAIQRAMDEGGREALLHYLMTYDLSDFEVRSVPQTQALQEQKMLSFGLEEQWWMERLMDGRTTRGAPGWLPSVMKDHLQSDYLAYAESQRAFRRVSPTVLGKYLKKYVGEYKGLPYPISVQKVADVERDDGQGHTKWVRERIYFYDLPSLEHCRQQWEQRYGGKFDWPAVSGDEPEPTQGKLEEPY